MREMEDNKGAESEREHASRPERLRACPICPACGSRKFRVIENSERASLVVVECLSCAKRISI